MPQQYTNPDSWVDARIIVATTLANLRLQTPPTYVGNTVFSGTQPYAIAIAIGATTALDGTAAIYAWNASSSSADNGTTVIAPSGPQVGGNPGRWIRLGSAL